MTVLLFFSVLFAAWPACLFVRNLSVFHPPTPETGTAGDVSILIPARNEGRNIVGAVEAALANPGAEVLVLDDLSSDETAALVEEISVRKNRVRLLPGTPLPGGWCGKNWACAQLAREATRPLLLFVDADVRLEPAGAATVAAWLRTNRAQLASGVPRQQLGGFAERLLIPLIHFVLLGFLPLRRMRQFAHPSYATGCGQLVMADAKAYASAGGHSAIRNKIHDGLALPRVFREHGLRTDLFDATEVATCRMYRSDAETWRGFSKNTHEGLGAPALIVPATLLLMVGQVVPFLCLLAMPWLTRFQAGCTVTAIVLALLPRVLSARRFRQPWSVSLTHPIAMLALLALQWRGLLRYFARKPVTWKAREYDPHPAAPGLTSDGVAVANTREQIPEGVQHSIY